MFAATPDKTWLNGFGTMERVNPSSDHGSSKSRFDKRRNACNGNAQTNGWILNRRGRCHRIPGECMQLAGTSLSSSVSFVVVVNGSPSGIVIVAGSQVCQADEGSLAKKTTVKRGCFNHGLNRSRRRLSSRALAQKRLRRTRY